MPILKTGQGRNQNCHAFPSILAPVKAAILPLSKKENLSNFARDIYKTCAPPWPPSTTIPNRSPPLPRQDEIGTPYCVTVDFQSLEDNRVTVRDRDSMAQIRIPIAKLKKSLLAKMDGEDFLTLPRRRSRPGQRQRIVWQPQ